MRVTDDCFAALARAFMASPKWHGYSQSSRDLWGIYLRRAAQPEMLGAVSLQTIRPALVQALIDGMSGYPGAQGATLAAIKQLERWAIVRDLLPRQITLGVEIEDSDGGHIPWTDEQVALAERYARPDIARAITLAANCGQRGSDLVRIGWSDIERSDGRDGINVKQKKTGREIWVPITSALAAAMQTWERQPGPFLRRPDGGVWTRKLLSLAWSRQRDSIPELEPLRLIGPDSDRPAVLHGLRGTACVRLLRAGANTRQISDMVGMSEPMVANYTRFSSQRENATAAVLHLERTIRERSSDKTHKIGG